MGCSCKGGSGSGKRRSYMKQQMLRRRSKRSLQLKIQKLKEELENKKEENDKPLA